jgi:hypothetical protein
LYCWVIDSLDQWAGIAARLTKAGYKRFITQYDIDDPEGLHISYWASGKPTVEFITHSAAVAAQMRRIPIE